MASDCCLKIPAIAPCEAAQNPARARRRRKHAATKYRPDQIRLLVVAEAPPNCLRRYFYFDDVAEHDALFRYIVRTVLGAEPSRMGKRAHLEQLRDAGVWLIDLKTDPKVKGEHLGPYVNDLVDRVAAARPEHVVLVKVTVYDHAFEGLRRARLPVVDERIYFPDNGQQKQFEKGMAKALKAIRWSHT